MPGYGEVTILHIDTKKADKTTKQSNKGMTTVIRELFDGTAEKASLNRPDFVIRRDGSIGFYSLPSYNDEHEEVGVGHLVI